MHIICVEISELLDVSAFEGYTAKLFFVYENNRRTVRTERRIPITFGFIRLVRIEIGEVAHLVRNGVIYRRSAVVLRLERIGVYPGMTSPKLEYAIEKIREFAK